MDDLRAVPPEAGHPRGTDVEVRALGPTRGGDEAVTIDRASLKLLASDTRLDILKALKARRMTVTELSTTLGLGKSTVHEHLGKLVEGGLVLRHDDPAREWVYYELTSRARRLLTPSRARIVLLFTSLLGLAALAVVLFTLAQNTLAVPPIVVDVDEDVVVAGAESPFHVRVTLENGDPVQDARVFLLTPQAAEKVRAEGEVPPEGTLPLLPVPTFDSSTANKGRVAEAPGPADDREPASAHAFRVALEPGAYFVYAQAANGVADTSAGMPLVQAVPARAAVEPSPLLVGADDARPLTVRLAGLGAPLAGAALTLNGTEVATQHGSAITGADGTATLNATLEAPGELTLLYRPAGNLSLTVPAAGATPVQLPSVQARTFGYLAGAENAVTVTVHHPDRRYVEGATVSVRDANGTRLAEDRTDALGQAHLRFLPGVPGTLGVWVGETEMDALVVDRGLTLRVHPAPATPGGNVTVTLLDPLGGAPVAGARVALEDAEAVTNATGEARLPAPAEPGRYGIRVTADGFRNATWTLAVGSGLAPPATPPHLDRDVAPAGEAVILQASVRSEAGERAPHTFTVLVDGEPHLRETLTLDPGESATLLFPLLLPEGEHAIRLAGSGDPPARLVVTHPEPSSGGADRSEDHPEPAAAVPAPGPLAALGALLAVAVVARRRRAG